MARVNFDRMLGSEKVVVVEFLECCREGKCLKKQG